MGAKMGKRFIAVTGTRVNFGREGLKVDGADAKRRDCAKA